MELASIGVAMVNILHHHPSRLNSVNKVVFCRPSLHRPWTSWRCRHYLRAGFISFNASKWMDAGTIPGQEVFEEIRYIMLNLKPVHLLSVNSWKHCMTDYGYTMFLRMYWYPPLEVYPYLLNEFGHSELNVNPTDHNIYQWLSLLLALYWPRLLIGLSF